jgi:ribose transport system permease protein
VNIETAEPVEKTVPREATGPNAVSRFRHAISFENASAIYVWIAIIILFSIVASDTFPEWQTAKGILNQNAIPGIVALSLVIPLSTRMFDLSIGSMVGLANMFCAWLMVKHGVSMVPAIAITLCLGLFVGLVNATVVVIVGIDSFIATLATGSLMLAAIDLLSNNQSISGTALTGGTFSELATASVAGITVAAILMVVVVIALWLFEEYTVTGRRMYATGFNDVAARLTGIRVKRLQFFGLATSALMASLAGILLTSELQSGAPDIGSPYLLAAFAAAFLGATQFKGGRFNAWGTLVAVLVLGTGQTGLLLAGAGTWAGNAFVGAVLLAALGLAAYENAHGKRLGAKALRRRRADLAKEEDGNEVRQAV